MKRLLIACTIFTAAGLCACSFQSNSPEREWNGLETRAYWEDEPDAIYASYVEAYELTGTPDPQTDPLYVTQNADLSQVRCVTEKTKYSVGTDSHIILNVTYGGGTEGNADSGVFCHSHVNIERLNGDAWQRLIYIPASWYTDVEGNVPQLLKAGETATRSVAFSCVATKLIPGKYRLVAYVNYEPVYAEFELTE